MKKGYFFVRHAIQRMSDMTSLIIIRRGVTVLLRIMVDLKEKQFDHREVDASFNFLESDVAQIKIEPSTCEVDANCISIENVVQIDSEFINGKHMKNKYTNTFIKISPFCSKLAFFELKKCLEMYFNVTLFIILNNP